MFGAYQNPLTNEVVCHRCLPDRDAPRLPLVILHSWNVLCAGCNTQVYSEDDRYSLPRKTLADYPNS